MWGPLQGTLASERSQLAKQTSYGVIPAMQQPGNHKIIKMVKGSVVASD